MVGRLSFGILSTGYCATFDRVVSWPTSHSGALCPYDGINAMIRPDSRLRLGAEVMLGYIASRSFGFDIWTDPQAFSWSRYSWAGIRPCSGKSTISFKLSSSRCGLRRISAVPAGHHDLRRTDCHSTSERAQLTLLIAARLRMPHRANA